MTRTRLVPAVVLGAALVTGLAGCGIHPGDAAHVGGRAISRDTLDEVTAAQCVLAAGASQSNSQQSQATSRATTTQSTLALLIQAEQRIAYGKAHDVSIDTSTLRTQQVSLTDQLSGRGLSRTERDAVLDVSETLSRGQLVVQSVGTIPIGTGTAAQSTSQAVLARGTAIVDRWTARRGPDVDIDPRYDIGLTRGQLQLRDGSVSRPVSTVAKQGVSQQPSQSYVTSLPLPQRCG